MCRTHVSSTISSRGKNHVYTPFSSPQSVSQVPVPHRVARPLQTCASLYEHEIKHIWQGTVPLLAHINDVSRLLAHNTPERTLIALLAPQAFLTARFLPGISHAQLHTTLSKGLADMSAAQFNVATADADIVKFLKVLLTYNQQFSRRHNLQDLRSAAFYSELFLDLANTAETHQLPDTVQWCIAEGLTRSRMSHDITLLYSTFFRKLLSAPLNQQYKRYGAWSTKNSILEIHSELRPPHLELYWSVVSDAVDGGIENFSLTESITFLMSQKFHFTTPVARIFGKLYEENPVCAKDFPTYLLDGDEEWKPNALNLQALYRQVTSLRDAGLSGVLDASIEKDAEDTAVQ